MDTSAAEVALVNPLSSQDAFRIRIARAIPHVSTVSVRIHATVVPTPNVESRTINRFARVNKGSTVIRKLNASSLNVAWTTIVPVSIPASTDSASRCVRLIPAVNKPNAMPRIIARFVNACRDMKVIHVSPVSCWDVGLIQIAHWIKHASIASVKTHAKTKQFALRMSCAKCTNTVRNAPVHRRSKQILPEDVYSETIDAEQTANVHRRRHVSKAIVSTRAM